MVEKEKCKKCPKCEVWIMKNEGCNHITCRCGAEFCYVCGKIYTVNGKRDCKCKLFNESISEISLENSLENSLATFSIDDRFPIERQNYFADLQ